MTNINKNNKIPYVDQINKNTTFVKFRSARKNSSEKYKGSSKSRSTTSPLRRSKDFTFLIQEFMI